MTKRRAGWPESQNHLFTKHGFVEMIERSIIRREVGTKSEFGVDELPIRLRYKTDHLFLGLVE